VWFRAAVTDHAARARVLVAAHGGTLGRMYDLPLMAPASAGYTVRRARGFAVDGLTAAAAAMRAEPDVENVAPDVLPESDAVDGLPAGPSAPQLNPANWGLDRVDQRVRQDGAPDGIYWRWGGSTGRGGPSGDGVDIYVLEAFRGASGIGGIDATLDEFTDPQTGARRVAWDATFFNERLEPEVGIGPPLPAPHQGTPRTHGTWVAMIAGGKTFGVAARAKLLAVRYTGARQGVNRIADIVARARANPTRRAVVNISSGFNRTGRAPGELVNVDAMDGAIRHAVVNDKIVFVLAAGNEGTDVGNYSPGGRVGDAITVGASTVNDARWDDSNFGPGVTLFAPGARINFPGVGERSGTSLAAPFVTGVAALLLEQYRSLTPAQVKTTIVETATPDVLTNLSDSPNRLLFIPSPVTYFDGDFAPGSWSTAVIRNGIGGGATTSQVPAGGAPGPFWRITHDLNEGRANVTTTHVKLGAKYDPAVMGEIGGIEFNAMGGLGIPGWGFRGVITPFLRQNGTDYTRGLAELWGSGGAWGSFLWYVNFAPTCPQNDGLPPWCGAPGRPDFRGGAKPVEFGFSVASWPQLDLDNWVTVVDRPWRALPPP
jgi:hypothetical protein